MADGHIEILIGARADRSLETVFAGAERRAGRARAGIDRALNAGGDQAFRGYEAASTKAANATVAAQTRAVLQVARMREREERRVEAQRIASERRVLTEQTKSANAEIANVKRVAAAREAAERRAQTEARRTSAASNTADRRARTDRQQAIDRQVRSQVALDRQRRQEQVRSVRDAKAVEDSFAYRTAYHGIIRYAPGALHRGARVANDIIRGAGVDLNVGSSVGRGVSLEDEAVKLSNSAFGAAKASGLTGELGQRRSTRGIVASVRANALKFGVSSENTMGGLREFVGNAGDLATAEAALPGLLALAKANGANPEHIFKTAGVISATRYDKIASSPQEAAERAKDIVESVNIGAASGFLGTTEIEHLARYGPKLAATAQAFSGNKTANLGEMFALAQMGLAGGAASPAQATTSVGAMVNTLRTPARRNAFAGAFKDAEKNDPLFRQTFGKNFALDHEGGRFGKASDIILASIMAAGTDTAKFKGMWANVQGARPIEGLRQRYLEAGGGEAGAKAVRSEFDKFGKTIDPEQLAGSLAAAMDTSATKAIQFQENLDKVVSEMAGNVLPQLSKMAPDALKIASFLGKAASWAAENPGRAITLAIVGSIARAGLESAVRLGLERVLASGASVVTRAGIPAGVGGGGGAGTAIVGGGAVGAFGGRGAKVARGALKGVAALGLGYTGYQLGQTLGDVTGDPLAGGMAGDVLGGAMGGAAFGLPGLAAGAALGAGKAIYRGTQEMGGFGALGSGIWNMLSHPLTPVKDTFFKGMDERENARARAAADQRGNQPVQAAPSAPMSVKAEIDPAVMAGAFGTALRSGEVAVRVVNLPPPGNGTAADPPEHGGAGRGRAL